MVEGGANHETCESDETCEESEFWAMGDTADVFGYLHGVSVGLLWEIPPRISKETNDVFKILRK